MTDDEITRLVTERDALRRAGDYAAADAIKARLLEVRQGMYGLALLDEPGGTFWHWTTVRD